MESPDDPLVRLGVAESRRVCTSSGIGSWTRGEFRNKPGDRRIHGSEHVHA
jgi:hypothetical protein